MCDRTPLDPLSFNEDAKMPAKARLISKSLSPGKSNRKAVAGQVILLVGDPEDLEARVVGRHKQSSAPLIADLQERLERVFSYVGKPVTIDTRGLSVAQVVKRVARIMLLENYAPIDLAQCLKKIEKVKPIASGKSRE